MRANPSNSALSEILVELSHEYIQISYRLRCPGTRELMWNSSAGVGSSRIGLQYMCISKGIQEHGKDVLIF